MLWTVLEETDPNNFQDYLETLLNRLSSIPQAASFLSYFRSEWCNKTNQWAYCYRLRSGINSNMYLKDLHKNFKGRYLNGKINKRVDVCMIKCLDFLRDKIFKRIIKLTKGKPTCRLQMIHDRHNKSLNMSLNLVEPTEEEGKFIVRSEVGENKYDVQKLQSYCKNADCRLVCSECHVCAHTFVCNCPDSIVLANLCKHIHLTQRFIDQQVSPLVEDDLDAFDIALADVDREKHAEEELCIAFCDIQTSDRRNNNILKKEISSYFSQIEGHMLTSTKTEAFNVLREKTKAALNTFIVMEQNQKIEPCRNEPANKKLEPKPRFFTVRRKRKSTNKVRFAKPPSEEKKTFLEDVTWKYLQGENTDKNLCDRASYKLSTSQKACQEGT